MNLKAKNNSHSLGLGSALGSSSSGTSFFNTWNLPERLEVNEVGESIEMIYKETSMICYTSYPAPPPEERVFKIVYSCVDGKWNKSERSYGKIIRASAESYEF